MAIPASAALWFLPFVLPICFYVAFTDMREMRITNQAVLALAAIYGVVGLIALPPWSGDWTEARLFGQHISLPAYAWGLVKLLLMLVVGFLLNAAGAMGAGDAKFIAAAAPFVMVADLRFLVLILCANMLAAVATHRLARATRLRRLAPHWESWEAENHRFPMGLSLAGSLAIYLILGAFFGA